MRAFLGMIMVASATLIVTGKAIAADKDERVEIKKPSDDWKVSENKLGGMVIGYEGTFQKNKVLIVFNPASLPNAGFTWANVADQRTLLEELRKAKKVKFDIHSYVDGEKTIFVKTAEINFKGNEGALLLHGASEKEVQDLFTKMKAEEKK